MSPTFTPQFRRSEVVRLLRNYSDPREQAAMAAGADIKRGRAASIHLKTIYEWKTIGRGKSRLRQNSEEEIREALNIATLAKQPRSAMAVLTGLYGVNMPVASAIATAIHPDRYTIIDFRALHALGHDKSDNSLPFYLAYLQACHAQASKWKLALRDLDRVLWQWSKEQGV